MDEGSVGPDKLIENWASAELRGDMASLGGFLADDFIGVGPRGFKLTKEEWLDRHATRKLRYENFQFDETRVRHYGGSAVVTGRQSVVGKYEDFDLQGQFRATLILVQQQGHWLLAGIHLSPIAGPP